MKKTLVIIGVIVVVLVLVAVAVGRGGGKPQIVKTAAVTRGDLKSYLSTNAVIKSKNMKSYVGTAQLPVRKVHVEVGDTVRKGQVMLEYDLYDMNTSMQQAKLQYDNALLQRNDLLNQKRHLDQTIGDLDQQIEELKESNNPADAVQLQALKQKREALQPISGNKIELADNAVSLAKLAYNSAASRYEKYKSGIVAGIDGVVTELYAAEGAMLNPAQPAVVIQQLSDLKATVSLGKYDALKVKVGQEALLSYGERTYQGVVSFISPAAVKAVSMTGQEKSLEADIDIQDAQPGLVLDFDVNADILLGSVNDVLKIPVECIKYDKSEGGYVYKLVDGKAKLVKVKLGLQSDMEAQVLEGLSLGDTVILNPGISIEDGTPVRTNEGGKA
ncbi:MAG: efflux RND transporter periplasmic adaptor subunit [Bacillota bacterium]